jgi:carbon-monoxide dehydrogenase large subunit
MQPEALDMRDGVIAPLGGGTPSISLADLAETVYFKAQLLPAGPQVNLSLSMHLGHDWPALVPTNGIQASLVEVDTRTGFVRLLRHWAVDDFGTVVNPLLVSEQVRGGIAQGIGQALYEELVYSEEGQLTNGTFADYLVPAAADLPDIVVEHVETPWPHTALGAKGAGEAGTTGAVGAVFNAVNDAIRPLGAKITELPMTPARMLKALGRL